MFWVRIVSSDSHFNHADVQSIAININCELTLIEYS